MDLPAHPPVATREEWLRARMDLLAEEKELTKHYDRVNAMRRRLPMVKVEKDYVFRGAEGETGFAELFDGQIQLIVYHFMFDPSWDEGCQNCTTYVKELGDLSFLTQRNTRFVLVSRAPYEKLDAYRRKMGWDIPWYSSSGTAFNYDFGVTLDPARGPIHYNFAPAKDWMENLTKSTELHGESVFFRMGEEVYHTYSTYARGTESLTDPYRLLDLTPYGRQEDFEDSPPGWPQHATYG